MSSIFKSLSNTFKICDEGLLGGFKEFFEGIAKWYEKNFC